MKLLLKYSVIEIEAKIGVADLYVSGEIKIIFKKTIFPSSRGLFVGNTLFALCQS